MASGLGVAPRQFSVTREALVAGELAGLLAGDLDLRVAVDDVVQALGAVDGRGGAGRADQLEDGGALGEEFEQRLALLLAAQDVVGADVRQRVHVGDRAVDGDDRDAGIHGFLAPRAPCRRR